MDLGGKNKPFLGRVSLYVFRDVRVCTSHALAMAKPPPSSRMMFQGTQSWAFFQDSNGTYSVFGAMGAEKNGKCPFKKQHQRINCISETDSRLRTLDFGHAATTLCNIRNKKQFIDAKGSCLGRCLTAQVVLESLS